MIKSILNNVIGFHRRFENWPPPMEGAGEALEEEFNEFLEACKNENHYAAAKELVDLVWVAVGYWAACFAQIDHREVLQAAIDDVAHSNLAKNSETHVKLASGHIVRRSKLKAE